MLTPVEIAALIAATKGTIDIFDKISGQIKGVILKRAPEPEGADDRWRYKISTENSNIVVTQDRHVVQTITGEQLERRLGNNELTLVKTFQDKMNSYYRLWTAIYKAKDASQDPTVNFKTEEQLRDLVIKMKGELVGIIDFLETIGVRLDDHYLEIRYIVGTLDQR
jgi:hypothetical protein